MGKSILTVTTAIFIIGIIHLAVTPITFKSYTIDALWFASAGFTLIFLAFLNYVLINIRQRQTKVFVVCHIANILCTIFVALLLTVAFEPHIIFLFVLLVSETLLVMRLQYSS
jgi:hypothetical protein